MPDPNEREHYEAIANLERPGVDQAPVEIDWSKASPARIYDYWLGGKDNGPADREAGEKVLSQLPYVREEARANRDFLRRSVHFMASQGIRQFLDLGTGIPTMNPTHEVAQAVHPDARVVYVDNDPLVLTHARALLRGGTSDVRQHDIRDPESILADPRIFGERGLLDPDEPLGLLFIAVLHFVDDAQTIVDTLSQVLSPGSYLAITHAVPETDLAVATNVYENATAQIVARTPDEMRELFGRTELLEPGLVPTGEWRPDTDDGPQAYLIWGGVGVMPDRSP